MDDLIVKEEVLDIKEEVIDDPDDQHSANHEEFEINQNKIKTEPFPKKFQCCECLLHCESENEYRFHTLNYHVKSPPIVNPSNSPEESQESSISLKVESTDQESAFKKEPYESKIENVSGSSDTQPSPTIQNPSNSMTSQKYTSELNAIFILCLQCKGKFHNQYAFRRHVFYDHTVDKVSKYHCPDCNLYFFDGHELGVHDRISHGVRAQRFNKNTDDTDNTRQGPVVQVLRPLNPLYCNYCEFSCLNVFDCYSHYEDKHDANPLQPNGINIDQCSECNQIFTNIDTLKQHLGAKHNADLRETWTMSDEIECQECDKMLPIKEMIEHFARDHEGKKLPTDLRFCIMDFQCSSCKNDKLFKSAFNYWIHRQFKHSLLSDKSYTCLICSLKYPHFFQLERHMKRHSQALTLQCIHCRDMLSNKAELFLHYKKKHKNVANPLEPDGDIICTCSECDQVFLGCDFLKSHLITSHFVKFDRFKYKKKRIFCKLCKEGAFYVKAFLEHHAEKHRGKRLPKEVRFCFENVSCSTCPSENIYGSYYAYWKHWKSKHSDEATWKKTATSSILESEKLRRVKDNR